MNALELQHPKFCRPAAGRREPTQLTAGRQYTMAGDDERNRIVGHRLAYITRPLRSGGQFLRQKSHRWSSGPTEAACGGVGLLEKFRLLVEVEPEAGKVGLFAQESSASPQ